MHIYREFNTVADALSKQALLLEEGRIYMAKFVNDVKFLDSHVGIF